MVPGTPIGVAPGTPIGVAPNLAVLVLGRIGCGRRRILSAVGSEVAV